MRSVCCATQSARKRASWLRSSARANRWHLQRRRGNHDDVPQRVHERCPIHDLGRPRRRLRTEREWFAHGAGTPEACRRRPVGRSELGPRPVLTRASGPHHPDDCLREACSRSATRRARISVTPADGKVANASLTKPCAISAFRSGRARSHDGGEVKDLVVFDNAVAGTPPDFETDEFHGCGQPG